MYEFPVSDSGNGPRMSTATNCIGYLSLHSGVMLSSWGPEFSSLCTDHRFAPTHAHHCGKWPTPKSTMEIQQFLGLVSYYRRFVKDFADIAHPLNRLTERNANFHWTQECQIAFDTLRGCLTASPVLAYPDYTKPFVLDTDASNTGIGVVLSQVGSDGEERVIAYMQVVSLASLSATTVLLGGNC